MSVFKSTLNISPIPDQAPASSTVFRSGFFFKNTICLKDPNGLDGGAIRLPLFSPATG
jgi:hypothetical protein